MELRGIRPELKEDLAKLYGFKLIGEGDCDVSDMPLVSLGYLSCGAIVILNGSVGGLSHIPPKDAYIESAIYDHPEEYVEDMIKEIGRADGLRAIVIGGTEGKRLEAVCRRYKLELVDAVHFKEDSYPARSERDILFTPADGEVYIYAPEGKIVKRF